MGSAHLARRALAIALLALPACSAPEPAPSVAGTYATAVSVASATEGCSLPVQDNPTVVQTTNHDSVVLLRHAGTTYGGALHPDLTFTTRPTTVTVDSVSYAMVVSGRFAHDTLDATVTLDYGTAPACRLVVRWVGRRAPA